MGYSTNQNSGSSSPMDNNEPELGPPTGQPQMGQPNQFMQPQAAPTDNLANGADPVLKPQVESFNQMMGNPWDNNKVSTGSSPAIGKGKS